MIIICAFANWSSARFALPGPEERRVVCSDIPTNSSKSCGVVTKPLSLPPPEDNIGSGPGPMKNCEPIIEEPTTPESSIEVVERDIEDAFYEDPDEIPEIKLNIEEFATNLKSFIQENEEMQEGDMSKAIIALSPQFASIPTPKLKHVSRLRTEHQVYVYNLTTLLQMDQFQTTKITKNLARIMNKARTV